MPLIAVLGACAPPIYVPPALDEPHATVVVRVVHHDVSGRDLQHDTLIDGRRVDHGGRTAVVRGAPLTRTVRVRPTRTEWRFSSVFSHTEQRMETVYETERYPCGTQTTGYGSSTRTTTRSCSRQVPRQRWRTVRVTDGECGAILLQTPQTEHRYTVQFDYHGHGSCRARCFEQTPMPGGRFQLTPCSMGGPPPTAGGMTTEAAAAEPAWTSGAAPATTNGPSQAAPEDEPIVEESGQEGVEPAGRALDAP